jgi:hypothetical protein
MKNNSGYDARVDSGMLEQFRQLGDVRRDAPRLLASLEPMGGSSGDLILLVGQFFWSQHFGASCV